MIEYSFVVPVYRDSELAGEFCAEFDRVFRGWLGKESIADDVELIFVNDDGTDATGVELKRMCDQYPFVKLINLSRNFGQHIALSCGYQHAQGRYVGMLNIDMEDPPDQIPVLLEALKKGPYDIMFGLRKVRQRPTSRLFHWLLNRLTGYQVPLNTSTLRVMSRPFVDAYNELVEKSRYIPGLEMWLGFRRGYVDVSYRSRSKGQSSYNLTRRLRMAIEAIVSFSDLPLRLVVRLGALIAAVGFALILYLGVSKLFFTEYQPGYTSTMSAIVFLGGVQILVTGVASLYIGRILREVQNRPLYVVRDSYRIGTPKQAEKK
jgi:dolichol-phosphate mannosyltransferase